MTPIRRTLSSENLRLATAPAVDGPPVLVRFAEASRKGLAGCMRGLVHPQLAPAVQLILDVPHRRLEASELAAASGLSRTAFFELFQEVVGEAPMAYLTRWRVHLAAARLRGKESLQRVALQTGFSDVSAMTKAFRRLLGVAPGPYRELAHQWEASRRGRPADDRFEG
jgi:AraC-like DNA-binding protein